MSQDTHQKKSRAPRISMATLLFVVLCVCGYLAGHKQGYRDGKALWDIMPVYGEVYLASDLLEDRGPTEVDSELDKIVSRIKREVVPECWEDAGGNCTVKAFPENRSVVVGANQYVHEEIKVHLKTLRDEKMMASASRVLIASPSQRTD